jgi:hypothetical protein
MIHGKGRGIVSYRQVTLEAMTRSTLRDVSAVLDVHKMSTHMLMTPRCIAREIGDVVPFVIGTPGKVHSVDLRTATEG